MRDFQSDRAAVDDAYSAGDIDSSEKASAQVEIDMAQAADWSARQKHYGAARPNIPNETEGIFGLIFWVIAACFKLVWVAVRWSLPRLHKIFGFLVAVGSAALLWAGLIDPLRSLLEGIFGDSVATTPRGEGSPLVVVGIIAVVGLIVTQIMNVRYGNVRVAFMEGERGLKDLYAALAALWTSIFVFVGLGLTVWRIAAGDDLGANPEVDSAIWMVPVGLVATAACVAAATWWLTRDARAGEAQAA